MSLRSREDFRHVGWLFRNMIRQAWAGDFHEAREAYYWILIHLSYESKRIDKETDKNEL